jgi:hypothetical protein
VKGLRFSELGRAEMLRLLTPAFRPGIEGYANQWGFSPKHRKGFEFMKKYGFERFAG